MARNLVCPVAEDSRVAGTYRRQVSRSDCNPFESRDIAIGAGPLSAVKMIDFQDSFQVATYHANLSRFIAFSNVSSCIRRDALEKLPFSETIVMMEDQEWCKRAIESGYWVIYEAASVVYHSHNHSLKMIYQRNFDYGRSLREFAPIPLSLGSVLVYAVLETAGDILFILRQRMDAVSACRWILKSPVVRFVMRYGLYRGARRNSVARAAKNAGVLSNQSEPESSMIKIRSYLCAWAAMTQTMNRAGAKIGTDDIGLSRGRQGQGV